MRHPDESPSHRQELLEMHPSTSGKESNKANTREKYGDSSLDEVNQHYQEPRHRTFPLAGPSYHSYHPYYTERSPLYHRMPHSGRPSDTDGTEERMDSAMTTSHSVSLHETVIATCDQCGRQGKIICRQCLKIVCKECIGVYTTDLCEITKDQHAFIRLTDIETSGDSKAYSSQESANTKEVSGNGEKDWSCSRCTLLNNPKHRICVACGATRGIGVIESNKCGGIVCRNCTLHNEETAAVCMACGKSLAKCETVL